MNRINLKITLNPDKIYPNETGSPVSSTITAEVTDSNGKPLSGYQVNFETEIIESKGHAHTNTRSAGTIGGWCVTDSSGTCTVNYYASLVAGRDKITAYLTSNTGVADSKEITVRVPNLSPLASNANLITWTSADAATKHELADSDNGTEYTQGAVYYAVAQYCKDYEITVTSGIHLAAIDMSLPWGGLFDVDGDWRPPHNLHRIGTSVDFSKKYKDANGNDIEVVFYDENGNVIEITGIINEKKLDGYFADKNFKCARLEANIGKIHYECPK